MTTRWQVLECRKTLRGYPHSFFYHLPAADIDAQSHKQMHEENKITFDKSLHLLFEYDIVYRNILSKKKFMLNGKRELIATAVTNERGTNKNNSSQIHKQFYNRRI